LVTSITVVHGGAGDDNLVGNALVSTVLVGHGGSDILTSSATKTTARGLLIGGAGADALSGGVADDLLIASSTSHDENDDALLAILDEWKSSRAYADRIANLQGDAGGLNNGFYLQNSPDTIYSDAPDSDTLLGNLGRDWFIADMPEDQLSDIVTTGNVETLTSTH
jgi:Ca2+-binding RTX toxin-like protein